VVRAASNTYRIADTPNQHVQTAEDLISPLVTMSSGSLHLVQQLPCCQLYFRCFPRLSLKASTCGQRSLFLDVLLHNSEAHISSLLPSFPSNPCISLTVFLCDLSFANFSPQFQAMDFFVFGPNKKISVQDLVKRSFIKAEGHSFHADTALKGMLI